MLFDYIIQQVRHKEYNTMHPLRNIRGKYTNQEMGFSFPSSFYRSLITIITHPRHEIVLWGNALWP